MKETKKILITGATGNVGRQILKHLNPYGSRQVYVASRDPGSKDPASLFFDFENLDLTTESLKKTDILFLLRPPAIADVGKYFAPLIASAKNVGLKHIVFLSVQGAEKTSFIPHAKIEKLIAGSGLSYTFIRPSYFMQNLTTTLAGDIRDNNRIFLPAGRAKFLWIDVADVGKAVAKILENPKAHHNRAYTLTGPELYNFEEVVGMLSDTLKRKIGFVSPNLPKFYLTKRKDGMAPGFIFVMIMLHYFPRFQKPPKVSNDFRFITGEEPNNLKTFIQMNKDEWK